MRYSNMLRNYEEKLKKIEKEIKKRKNEEVCKFYKKDEIIQRLSDGYIYHCFKTGTKQEAKKE